MKRHLCLLALAASTTFASFTACSSSTVPTGTASDSGASDTGALPPPPPVEGGSPDAARDASPPGQDGGGGCSRSGFTAVAEDGLVRTGDGALGYFGQNTLGAPVDAMEVDLIPLSGGAVAVGKRTLTKDDASYKDCATCVLIYTQCDADLNNCKKTFIATSGAVDVTTFGGKGGKFNATIDATLAEVTIADDGVTTPVAGGETWCLTQHKIKVDKLQ